jgi:hypothetical protein
MIKKTATNTELEDRNARELTQEAEPILAAYWRLVF